MAIETSGTRVLAKKVSSKTRGVAHALPSAAASQFTAENTRSQVSVLPRKKRQAEPDVALLGTAFQFVHKYFGPGVGLEMGVGFKDSLGTNVVTPLDYVTDSSEVESNPNDPLDLSSAMHLNGEPDNYEPAGGSSYRIHNSSRDIGNVSGSYAQHDDPGENKLDQSEPEIIPFSGSNSYYNGPGAKRPSQSSKQLSELDLIGETPLEHKMSRVLNRLLVARRLAQEARRGGVGGAYCGFRLSGLSGFAARGFEGRLDVRQAIRKDAFFTSWCCLAVVWHAGSGERRMRSVEERLAQFRRNAGRPPPPDTVLSAMDKDADSCPSVSPAEVDAPTGVVQVPIQASWPWSSMYERAPRLCLVSIALSWLLLQLYFSYIQFGLVFFVLSLFVCIFLNLGKRRAGELSAYSVFNPHCERLPGTLTAEQLERDLLLQQRP